MEEDGRAGRILALIFMEVQEIAAYIGDLESATARRSICENLGWIESIEINRKRVF